MPRAPSKVVEGFFIGDAPWDVPSSDFGTLKFALSFGEEYPVEAHHH